MVAILESLLQMAGVPIQVFGAIQDRQVPSWLQGVSMEGRNEDVFGQGRGVKGWFGVRGVGPGAAGVHQDTISESLPPIHCLNLFQESHWECGAYPKVWKLKFL